MRLAIRLKSYFSLNILSAERTLHFNGALIVCGRRLSLSWNLMLRVSFIQISIYRCSLVRGLLFLRLLIFGSFKQDINTRA